MRRSATLVGLAIAALAMSAGTARAEHAQVRLSYASAKAPSSCPDEATFRGLVAARLGYDPFVTADVRSLSVGYEQRGAEVVGRLELSAAGDAKPLSRSLRAAAEECFELATSLALVVAVAVDPNALSGAQPTEAPSQTPPPQASPPPATSQEPSPTVPSEPARPAPHPSENTEDSWNRPRVSVGVLVNTGLVPAVTLGGRAGAALDLGAWSIGLEGSFLSRGAKKRAEDRGEVSGYVLASSLAPCFDPVASARWGLELCVVGTVGILHATARQVTRAAPTRALVASVGPRVATRLMVSRALGLGVSAEVPLALSRTHLYLEEGGEKREVWAQPPAGFIFAISLMASIL